MQAFLFNSWKWWAQIHHLVVPLMQTVPEGSWDKLLGLQHTGARWATILLEPRWWWQCWRTMSTMCQVPLGCQQGWLYIYGKVLKNLRGGSGLGQPVFKSHTTRRVSKGGCEGPGSTGPCAACAEPQSSSFRGEKGLHFPAHPHWSYSTKPAWKTSKIARGKQTNKPQNKRKTPTITKLNAYARFTNN